VLGVIETGANAAQASTKTGDVLVMATAATVESHAYSAACHERGLRAIEKAAPLLVPLVEEGWVDHPVTTEVLCIYLAESLEEATLAALQPDTLVLGCTHYPLLRATFERALPPFVRVIDSAEATATQVAAALCLADKPCNPDGKPHTRRFYATDSVNKFRNLGTRFLGQRIEQVELIDLGG